MFWQFRLTLHYIDKIVYFKQMNAEKWYAVFQHQFLFSYNFIFVLLDLVCLIAF